MGKIKKIQDSELVGGSQAVDVYPITSIKAVYDENNKRLDEVLENGFNEVKSIIIPSNRTTNLFNDSEVQRGYYVSTTGAIVAGEGWTCSGYIPVELSTKYYITYFGNVSRRLGGVWLNSSKERIGYVETIYDTVLTSPSEAAYFVFNVEQNNGGFSKVMMIEGSSAPTEYKPYREISSSTVEGLSELSAKMDEIYLPVKDNIPSVVVSGWTDYNLAVKALYIDLSKEPNLPTEGWYIYNILRNYGSGRYELWIRNASIPEGYITIKLRDSKPAEVLSWNLVTISEAFYNVSGKVIMDWSQIEENTVSIHTGYLSDKVFIASTYSAFLSEDVSAIGGKVDEVSKVVDEGLTPFTNSIGVQIDKSTNLLDPSTLTTGFMNPSGTVESSSIYRYNNVPIPVKAGSKYRIWTKSGSAVARKTCYYNGDTVVLGGSSENIAEFTIPDGVDGLVVSVHISYADLGVGVFEVVEGSSTVWEEYHISTSPYLKQKSGDLPRSIVTREDLSSLEGSTILTVENSDKILFTGCSYDESVYSLRHKNYFDKLSNLTDWVCGNIGVSGYRIIDIVNQLRSNKETYKIKPKEFKPTYITIANNGNEYFPSNGQNLNLYWEQARMANEYIKSLGAKLILGTNYHVNGNPFVESMLKTKADELGVPYMGIGWIGSKVISQAYQGFWGGSHPGTRANAFIWQEWLYFINQTDSPRKAIKVFRPRYSGKSIDELNYDSNIQRAERWIEINIGGKCLKVGDGSEDYYDRLDEGTKVDPDDENNIIKSYNSQNEDSEYMDLINKTPVSFNDQVLVEFILDKVDIDSAQINIVADSGIQWYIKDNNNPDTYVPNTRDTETAFKVSKEVYDSFSYPEGTKFKTSKFNEGNTELSYRGKLKSYSMGKGYFLCFSADTSSTNKQSGSGTLELVSSPSTTVEYINHMSSYRYDYKYFNSMFAPQSKFVAINSTYSDGSYIISVSDRKYFSYDKIKLVGVKSGSFTISDLSCTYSGGVEKVYKVKQIEMKQQGEELITTRGFTSTWDSDGGWTSGGNIRAEMPSDVRSYPPYLTTNSHVVLGLDSDGFPQQISKAIEIDTSNNLTYKTLIVRATVRLFPKIFNPTKTGEYFASTAQVTSNSFDYSNLCIELNSGSMLPMVKKCIVDIGWSQVEVRIPLPPFVNSFKLSLYRDTEELVGHESDNFEMQLADVSAQVV